ncbi:nuclear transport factor 2 family protein [Aquisediminimonas sediminicola]|uniref:nuclear transport factor 2 family protein n=1 Tax=Alteraquisediminimonas sediminicola TaxID=2676787 RepID=UPI001FE446AA|nr:nuclear transport factor 2 family protein [Aquisediminimonas sediminicola]
MTNTLTQDDLTRIRRMFDESAIRDLLTDYTDAVDWIDWQAMDKIFWPDAILDYGFCKGDTAAIMPIVVSLEESYRRRLHMLGMPRIHLDGDQARADACSVIVARTDNDGGGVDDIFWGRYLFTAERRGDVWRLSSLTYLLNLLDSRQRDSDDRDGPVLMADDLTPDHPHAPPKATTN